MGSPSSAGVESGALCQQGDGQWGLGTCLRAAQELRLLFGNTNCCRFVISGEKLHLVISMFFVLCCSCLFKGRGECAEP